KSNSLQEEFPGLLCVLKLRNTIPIHVCNRQTESTPKSNSCWLLSAVRKIVKRTPGSITDVAPVVDQVRCCPPGNRQRRVLRFNSEYLFAYPLQLFIFGFYICLLRICQNA